MYQYDTLATQRLEVCDTWINGHGEKYACRFHGKLQSIVSSGILECEKAEWIFVYLYIYILIYFVTRIIILANPLQELSLLG